MKRLACPSLALIVIAVALSAPGDARVAAQNRMTYSVVSPDSGHVALGLAIRKLNVSGTFMQAPAHPDDETNALFALFTHGMGLRSIDVQNNRGEGGQNEIGPELFRDIGVLRTSELVAAHRIDGAEQYFTRAIDYGYSFDPEEVINNGDKRMELNVVPAYSVRVTPPLAVIPAPVAGAATPVVREIHVAVTNGAKGAAAVNVALELPAGWRAVPASVAIAFAHEDESLSARFMVTAPAQVKPGEYTVRAVATSTSAGAERFAVGYQDIEYPHIQRRQIIKPAETVLKIVDVKLAPGLTVGYVNGVGDQVPPAIEQLGAKLAFIDQDELAWGDLSKYNVIVTGVRAYERRADLRAYNRRLLEYAEQGGTVIVQYNKFEFNQSQYGPFPASVSGNRVSDEAVPVKLLVPTHPVFNYPNTIGPATWANWTQERGLYFLGEKDPKYIDLVSMNDSFQDNPGEKLGSLVEARVGKGRWIYLGLGLWRQLPAGTEGAYQLLANLLSVPKAPAGPAAP